MCNPYLPFRLHQTPLAPGLRAQRPPKLSLTPGLQASSCRPGVTTAHFGEVPAPTSLLQRSRAWLPGWGHAPNCLPLVLSGSGSVATAVVVIFLVWLFLWILSPLLVIELAPEVRNSLWFPLTIQLLVLWKFARCLTLFSLRYVCIFAYIDSGKEEGLWKCCQLKCHCSSQT